MPKSAPKPPPKAPAAPPMPAPVTDAQRRVRTIQSSRPDAYGGKGGKKC
jgi:hypothetical protein